MKTVVHVLPYMAQGGTEKHVLTLLRGLRREYRSILLAPRGEILGEFLKLGIEYVDFQELKGNVPGKIRAFKGKLRDIDRRHGVDLVHVHAAHEFLAFSRKALPAAPIIFHLSAHQGSALSRFVNYALSARIARRNADLLIAVSEEEKRVVVRRGYPPGKAAVVFNGYEEREADDEAKMRELREEHGLDGGLIVGNLGRFHRTKRLDLLLRAFEEVRRRSGRRLKLLMIGDGPDRTRLEKLARALGLDAAFPGFVARGDRVLRMFDVFVLPTTFEGCSNVLAEAMAKGRPIVTTDIPSVAWMFEDGENALLFPKDDSRALAEALLRLVEDDGLRRRVGEGAYKNYRERFDAGIMIGKVRGIYERLFDKKEA